MNQGSADLRETNRLLSLIAVLLFLNLAAIVYNLVVFNSIIARKKDYKVFYIDSYALHGRFTYSDGIGTLDSEILVRLLGEGWKVVDFEYVPREGSFGGGFYLFILER